MRRLFLLSLLFCSYLLANETDSTMIRKRHYLLDEIKVIAERPSLILGSTEIKQYDSLKTTQDIDLSESIEKFNGLDISYSGKSGKSINIRGFSNDKIKIFLDGKPISGGYFDSADLGTIPISEIEEIQVVKGPVSNLFGHDTMGGIINIVTKSASTGSWLKIGTQFRRNNTFKNYFTSSHAFSKISFWFSASYYHTDGLVLSKEFNPTNFEEGGIYDNSRKTQYDFQTKINFTLADFHHFEILAGYTGINDREIPNDIYGMETKYRRFLDWKRYQLALQGNIQIKHNLKYKSNMNIDYYDDTYAEYTNNDYDNMISSYPSMIDNYSCSFNNSLQFDWKSNSSYFGLNITRDFYDRIGGPGYTQSVENQVDKVYIFNLNEIKYRSLKISAGLAGAFYGVDIEKNSIYHIEPSMGLFYSLKQSDISLTFARNTRYPSLHELFSHSSGNEDLNEETANKYEITLSNRYTKDSFALNINQIVFLNNIKNLIEKKGGQYVNVDEFDSYGYEFSISLKKITTTNINYSLLLYNKSDIASVLETPRNRFQISEEIPIKKNYSITYFLDWTDIVTSETDTKTEKIPAHMLHSLAFSAKYKNYKTSLELRNIFDTYYEDSYGYPGEGFNFIFSFEVEI